MERAVSGEEKGKDGSSKPNFCNKIKITSLLGGKLSRLRRNGYESMFSYLITSKPNQHPNELRQIIRGVRDIT